MRLDINYLERSNQSQNQSLDPPVTGELVTRVANSLLNKELWELLI